MATKEKGKESKKRSQKKQYVLNDDKINILLMGTSGAGKSTLINAILPGANAPTGRGLAVTKEITPYTTSESPFTLIDSVGYEYSVLKQIKLKEEISKWIKTGVKKEDPSKYVHMIWFCIEAQSEKIPFEVLDCLKNVVRLWKNIPIIIVFTKSYGTLEEDALNIKTFEEVLSNYKHKDLFNIKSNDIIPVVAQDKATMAGIVPVKGLDTLVERTNELIPEAKNTAEKAISELQYRIKRTESNGWVAVAVVSSATVGAIPIKFPDATLIVPIQTAMITKICSIYKVKDGNLKDAIVQSLLEAGAVTMLAKALLNKLKDLPGFAKIGGSVLNAIVAGTITGILGESCITILEMIQKGQIHINDDFDFSKWVNEIVNGKMPKYIEVIAQNLKDIAPKDIPQALASLVKDIIDINKEKAHE